MKLASLFLSLVALAAFGSTAEARGRFFHRHCNQCNEAPVACCGQTVTVVSSNPIPPGPPHDEHGRALGKTVVPNYGRDNAPPTIILTPNQSQGCDGGRCFTFPMFRRGR